MKAITLDIDAPDGLPVSLETLKADLRIVHDDLDDVLVEQYIPDAVEWAEGVMRRSILARTHRWILEDFPRGRDQTIVLPRGKCSAVASIVYSYGGELETLRGPTSGSPVGEDYQEDLRGHAGRLMPNRGSTWPSVDCDVPSPIVITYTAGWEFDQVPADIRRAISVSVADAMEVAGFNTFNAAIRDTEFRDKLLSAWRIL